MKKIWTILTIIAVFMVIPVFAGATTTTLNSGQLAASASNGYILTTNGTNNAWTAPASAGITLDIAYDGGNTIDFTGDTYPVLLAVPNGASINYSLSMTYNSNAAFNFGASNGIMNICDPATGNSTIVFNGSNGTLEGNYTGAASGDLAWQSDNDGYMLFVDASADRVGIGTNSPQFTHHVDGTAHGTNLDAEFGAVIGTTFVANEDAAGTGTFRVESGSDPNSLLMDYSVGAWFFSEGTVYSGDADTAGTIYVADGSANYIGVDAPAVGTDWTLTLPAAVPGDDYARIPSVDTSGDTTWSVDRDHYEAAYSGTTGADAYTYINNNLQYSATVGWLMPRRGTVTAITVNCGLNQIGIGDTLDVYPYDDGAAINANCKLQVSVSDPHQSVTFTPGTYVWAAGSVMSVYLDFTDTELDWITVYIEYATPAT